MPNFKVLIDKPRSDDFIEFEITANDSSIAYRFGEALAQLMGTDNEWCPKLEKNIDKSWSCSSVAEQE